MLTGSHKRLDFVVPGHMAHQKGVIRFMNWAIIPAFPHSRIPAFPHSRIPAFPHSRIPAFPHWLPHFQPEISNAISSLEHVPTGSFGCTQMSGRRSRLGVQRSQAFGNRGSLLQHSSYRIRHEFLRLLFSETIWVQIDIIPRSGRVALLLCTH